MTKVKELMTENPVTVAPESTLMEAARKMKSVECGVLPVGDANNLEGIITDRDIVIRAVAEGKDPAVEKVSAHMTPQLFFCKEDETLEQAADQMRFNQVNRLVVQNGAGKMVGILTFGCILRKSATMSEVNKVLEHTVGKKAA